MSRENEQKHVSTKEEHEIEPLVALPLLTIDKKDRYISGLDGLRFISAIWLFWEHYGYDWNIDGWESLITFQHRGQIPLQYFFLMGGLVLHVAYTKSKDFSLQTIKNEYWLNRFSRVVPNYWLSLFINLPAVIGNLYYFQAYTTQLTIYFTMAFIMVPFMLQGWVLPTEMIFVSLMWGGMLWAMSPFAFFWLIFPWLLRFVERDRPLRLDFLYLTITWLISVLPFFIIFLLEDIPIWFNTDPILNCPFCVYWWARIFPPLRVSSQMIGMFIGKIYLNSSSNIRENKWNGVIGDVAFLATLLLTLFIPDDPTGIYRGSYTAMLDTLLSPLQGLTLWGLACRKGFLSYILNLKFFIYFGKLSFGIWSYQLTAVYIFDYFNLQTNWWISIIAFIWLIGFAILSYHFFETPARNSILSLRLRFPRYFP